MGRETVLQGPGNNFKTIISIGVTVSGATIQSRITDTNTTLS